MAVAEENVYIFHYSQITPYKGTVIYEDNEILKVEIYKQEEIMSFKKNDPVVVYSIKNQRAEILSCDVTAKDLNDCVLIAKKEVKGSTQWEEKRQFERYPVSLYADIKVKSLSKRNFALIKNLSYSGMLIYSKAEIPEEEQFDIDLYADKQVIFLKAVTVRKLEHTEFSEYGIQMVYTDFNSIETMKKYVEGLRESHKKIVVKLESINKNL